MVRRAYTALYGIVASNALTLAFALVFHFAYLVFLIQGTIEAPRQVIRLDQLSFIALGASFIFTHARSYRDNVEANLSSKPNLGTLMFMPYLRVLPMHLVIIFGATRRGGAATAGPRAVGLAVRPFSEGQVSLTLGR